MPGYKIKTEAESIEFYCECKICGKRK